MSGKKSLFQIVVLSLFGIFAVLGLIFFATYSSKNKTKDIGRVIIWGTVKQEVMNSFLRKIREDNPVYKKVLYAEYPEYNFQEKVTDALAAGDGPDIIILRHENLLKYKNKLYPISYETFDRRAFKERFIDGAEIFMAPQGIYGIPFAVDPIVLYYNRDIFADNMVVEAPTLWKQIPGLSAQMTVRDKSNNIDVATIALGAYDNVTNAYAILSTLIQQAGVNITIYNPSTGEIKSGLSSKNTDKATKAVKFFTAFANPVSNVYTWNRSLPESLEMFTEDKLAMYIGFESDLPIIIDKNPQLNFDIAEIPQVDKKDKDKKTRTYASFWAFSITKASKNKTGAYQFTLNMLQPKYAKMLTDMLGISYAQRQLLSKKPDDPLKLIFRNSAIISYGFLDPDPKLTKEILSKMVSDIISGQSFPQQATALAGSKLQRILSEFQDR